MKHPVEQETQLLEDISAFAYDPYGYVLYNYPWGEEHTPLAQFDGPREWQADTLKQIRDHLQENKFRLDNDMPPVTYQEAIVSGRGIGKSAEFGMLTNWMLDTHIGASVILTANTESQLRTKTFPEMGRWFSMALTSHWWNVEGFKIWPQAWLANIVRDQLRIDTQFWGATGQNWSEENPEAFAGMHNMAGLAVFYDEASGIPAPIWTVTSGFFTEPTPFRLWMAFSNGRRNAGAFFDRFHDENLKQFWRTRSIDARTVEGADQSVYNEIIATHGAHSDEARIEVYGKFPNASPDQFIANDVVDGAVQRELNYHDDTQPLILGVDPAPRGRTVLRARQGRDARTIPRIVLNGKDNIQIVDAIVDFCNKYDPDAIAIDAGQGTGVIDLCKKKNLKVHEVWFGAGPMDPDGEYGTLGTELWGRIKDWLPGGVIDDSKELKRDLTVRTWKWLGREEGKKILTSKKEMAKDGIPSPDDGDALALTFFPNVPRRKLRAGLGVGAQHRPQVARDVDYPIFGA